MVCIRTEVTRRLGETNIRFECLLNGSSGNQILTQWRISSYEGVQAYRDVSIISDIVIYEGTPVNGSDLISNLRNILILTEFRENLDRTTVGCAISQDVIYEFPLFIYRKCVYINVYIFITFFFYFFFLL